MMYFKFTDKNGDEMYGSINADREQIDLNKLKELCHAETLEEVSKEEYDEQGEE